MKNKFFFVLIILSSAGTVFAQEQLGLEFVSKESREEKPAASTKSTVSTPRYQNRISLDIKGMDIVDVLKTLATRTGMNIVVGKNVTGRVAFFLKDVDVWDALEIILLSNDLAYEKKGDIINVMTQRDYEAIYGERYQDKKQARIIQLKYAKAADLSRALSLIKTNVGKVIADEGSNTLMLIDTSEKLKEMEEFIKNTDLPLQTRVFNLNYASAEKIGAKIQEAITKGVGSVKIDERTNKIVVTDYPEKLDNIAQVISAFDEKTSQVLIDAQIIQLTPSDKLEMGVDWDYWIKKYFEVKARLPINTDNTLFLGTTSASPTEKGQYKAVIDILRTIGDTKVLASPRVMALNNQEAKILVGIKDAYITSTTSQTGTGTAITSQSVNFVDTGIQLYVTPTINRDGFVTMKIKPEISEATRTSITSQSQKTDIPIVSTSQAETTVMVKDGVTIIIGGLKKDKREKTVKKIPLIGDIPGLGFLFRSTSDNLTKTDLVILLTPHIMSGESSFSDFSEVKPKDGAVVEMNKGNIIVNKVSSSEQNKTMHSLVSKNYNVPEYYQLITNKILQVAKLNSPTGKKGEVNLSFSISRNGNLIKEPTVINTTGSSLIPFALKAIKDASPFPSFPERLEKAEERFSITIDYK